MLWGGSSLIAGLQEAGDHMVAFGASSFSSGIYYYRLTVGLPISLKSDNIGGDHIYIPPVPRT